MKKVCVFVFLLVFFISCGNDGFVVKLNYLNSNGQYESVKIKNFESGEKLSDRIDSTKTEYYKESDKELYDKATANVIITDIMGDSMKWLPLNGGGYKFTGWNTEPQKQAVVSGMEGVADWSVDLPIREDIEVYAQYEQMESVGLTISSPTDAGWGLYKTITADSEGEARNFTADFTVSIYGATLAKTLSAEEISEKVKFCSGINPVDYSLYPIDYNIETEITECVAEADSSEITFKIKFIGEDCPEAGADGINKSGNIAFELSENDLNVDENYYISTNEIPIDNPIVVRNNVLFRYSITYEPKSYVEARFADVFVGGAAYGSYELVVEDAEGDEISLQTSIQIEGATFSEELQNQEEGSQTVKDLVWVYDKDGQDITAADTIEISANIDSENAIIINANIKRNSTEEETTGTIKFEVSCADLVKADSVKYVMPAGDNATVSAELPYTIKWKN